MSNSSSFFNPIGYPGSERKNLFLNSLFRIDQRETSSSALTSGDFVRDRWYYFLTTAGALACSARYGYNPNYGVGYSGVYVDTAQASLASTEGACALIQKLESLDLVRLTDGGTLTLSFSVWADVVGTYSVSFVARNASAVYSVMVKEFTVNTSGIWERKEITVEVPAGYISHPGAEDMGLQMILGGIGGTSRQVTPDIWHVNPTYSNNGTANCVNWAGSSGNRLYFGNAQLEIGDIATPLEYRSYGDELSMCQRFYWQGKLADHASYKYGSSTSASVLGAAVSFPTVMRDTPTVSIVTSPTYSNCTFASLIGTAYGMVERVDVGVDGDYRAFNGVYKADAEL